MTRHSLFLAGLLAVGALTFAGCHKSPGTPPADSLPVASVRVQTVESKKYLAAEEVVGTVRAKVRATIEAKVSGRIEQMPVVAGQAVKAGDLLAQLDVRELQARLDQGRAMNDQTQRDRKRFESLLQQKTITQQEFDAVDARAKVAEATVKEVETMLGYARVTAPFDGVITHKLADAGDLATPGRPLLELEDPQSLRFEADIPESLIEKVPLGAKLVIRASATAGGFEGVVSEVAPAADPNSRTFRAKLDLPPAAGLRLGQFGRVAVPVAEISTPRVPVSAVVKRGQMEIVFVVANQAAQMRLVKTGKRFDDEIELLSGVAPGEPIVVEGAGTLLDGQPVKK